jgi:ammonium transporter, Amt family
LGLTSFDVFAAHGLGGMLCSLLLAAFALPALGGSGYGHQMNAAGQLGAQAIGVAAAAAWLAICTYLLVKLLDATVGARVSLEEERNGLELVSPAE